MKWYSIVVIVFAILLIGGLISVANKPGTQPQGTNQTGGQQAQATPSNPTTTCTDGDGVCPAGCNVFNDNDCKALTPGTSADSGNLRLSVSNPHIEVCTSDYSVDNYTYLVFDVSVENKGTTDEYISSMEFSTVDPNRKQFEGSVLSYPIVISPSDNCKNAKNDAFSGGNLLPGSKYSGKIWIELSKTGSYAKGKWFVVHKKTFSLKDVYTIYEAQIS